MIIIDDFIPLSYQEDIKRTLLGSGFPWYFTNDVTFGNKAKKHSPANAHSFRFNNQTTSEYYNAIAPLAHLGAAAANYQFNDVVQCRSFLQFPINEKFINNKIDNLHIDLPYDHLVVLYYVFDADGDTIIVDKQRTNNEEELFCQVSDYNIIKKVTPKQGRAVIFDGKYYHTAEQPSTGMRCIINFDII